MKRYIPTVLLLGASVTTPLGAQVLEEVIVTAQKREQSMQDVPIALSAFSGEKLAEAGIRDMFELQSNAPSLSVGASQASTTATFGIRGVFTSSQNFGLESSVGLYVDEVYRARQSSMINNLVDVASVEVLRGPQGTLFGRNTPSGAVSVRSVKPDHEGSGFIEGSLGDYDLASASGAVSISAIENVLAFRVTGFGMERDGFISDVALGDDVMNDRDRWGTRLQALWTPSDTLSIHVIADYSEIDETCCGTGTWRNNFEADSLPPGSPPKFGTDTTVRDRLGGTVLPASDFYDYRVAMSFLPESENDDSGLSVQVDWDSDAFLFTSITAYREYNSYDRIDADFLDVDALARSNDAEQSQFSQEFRISNTFERFSYVAGIYYFHQELDSVTDTIVGADAAGLVSGLLGIPVPDAAFPADTGSRNVTTQDNDSYAVFGQIDYNLTETLVLTGGLRWTKEDKDMQNVFTEDASDSLDFISPGWGFWLFPPLAPREDVDETIDDDQVTGTLKLSWFATDTIMLYASYGTGYKAGGVNTDRIPGTLPVVFDAETADAYEVGMKAEFPEQAMRLNVALHRTDTDDLQTISFQGTGFALQNAGVAETQGLEMDFSWQPLDALTLNAAYAWNDGEYADFEGGSCWVSTPWHTNQPDPEDNGDGSCDRSGGLLSGNPEHKAVVSGNLMLPLGSDLGAFLYGEYIYTDERMTDVNNDPAKLDGSFGIVNLRAGLRVESWDMDVTAWLRNATDEDYTSTIADAVVQDGRLIAYYNEPRTWGLTVRKHF
jgi:outer membrane receptor protein involved in Fe transport